MKLLSGFHMERDGNGKAFLASKCVVDLQKGYKGYHQFSGLKEGVFAGLQDDILTILEGLSWDECSPSFYFRGKRIGTPCSEAESFASLIHDVTRRIYRLVCIPFGRKDTDDFFYDALTLKGSKVKHTYHFAVSSFFGTVFIWITAGKMDCYCKQCNR